MKRWLLRATIVLAALAIGGCGRSGRGPEGTVNPHGDVFLVRGADARKPIDQATPLKPGDEVRVDRGTAEVALPAGGTLTLRAGSVASFLGGPRLETGDLLVASKGRSVAVEESTGEVVVSGTSRLRRDLALTVGSYRGQARVSTAGRTLVVPAYRQTTVAAVGLLPDQPAPLVLDSSDAWDREELGQAIDLTSQLDQASRGFTASVPEGAQTDAVVLRRTVTPLASIPAFTDQLISSTAPVLSGSLPPGELLVGAGIAVSGQGGTFDSRWRQAFAFRDQGAAWGLVALDQHSDTAALMNVIAGGLNQATLVLDTSVNPGPLPPFDGRVALVANPPQPPATTTTAGPTRPTPAPKPPGPGNPLLPPLPPVTLPPNVLPSGSPSLSSLLSGSQSSTTSTTVPSSGTTAVDPVAQLLLGTT